MIRGLYNAAAGMIPRSIEEEIAANNLANVTTTGYKKDVVHFRRLLDGRIVLNQLRGEPIEGGPPEEVVTRFTQGELKPTGNSLDVALEGEGFFLVLTPRGERLTRNGNFQLDADGQLVTAQGYPVLGESGPVQLFPGEVVIRENGEIYQNGALVDRLRIVSLPRPYPLMKEGEGLFRLTESLVDLPEAENVVVRQGYLEDSNVNPVTEMIRLITLSKAFQAGQKAIHAQDRTLEKAVNTVGRF